VDYGYGLFVVWGSWLSGPNSKALEKRWNKEVLHFVELLAQTIS